MLTQQKIYILRMLRGHHCSVLNKAKINEHKSCLIPNLLYHSVISSKHRFLKIILMVH